MKTLLRNPWWLLVLAVACNKEDDAKKADCEASSVTLVNGSPVVFNYDVRENNHSFVTYISVNSGTDSSYSYGYTYTDYTLGYPSAVYLTRHNNQQIQYDIENDGTNLTKFRGHVPNNGTTTDEYRFVYSSGRMSEVQAWLANTSGLVFQVVTIKFFYDGAGNMIRSEEYADFVAVLSLAFGSDPTGYAPILIGSEEYEVGDSPNPLYGEFYVDQMFWCVLKNVPKSITYKDSGGSTIKTETLTLTKDGNNYPTMAAISASKYMEAAYVCR